MTPLPAGWIKSSLGDLLATATVFTDGDWVETKDQDPEGDVRLTQLADVGVGKWRDRSGRYMRFERATEMRCTFLESGDVLVARMPEPLGRACLFPGDDRPCVTAVDVCVIRPNEHVANPRWLMWMLNAPSVRSQMVALQSGTTRKRISRANLATITLVVPPREEQDRIVAAIEEQFSRIDVGIESIQSAEFRCQQLREAVLATTMSRDWPARRIGEFASVGSGATPKRGRADYYEGGTIPWVTSGQLIHEFVTEPAEYITDKALKETSVKLWPKHTLLVAMYGEGRTRGHCSELLFESTTNQACAAVVLPEDAPVSREYLKLFFAANYERNRRLASGGVQPNLSLGLIRNMEVPAPPIEEQARIVEEVHRQLTVLTALRRAGGETFTRAEALRRSILSRAFAGSLVSQDPKNEPVSLLLERIRAESAVGAKSERRMRS